MALPTCDIFYSMWGVLILNFVLVPCEIASVFILFSSLHDECCILMPSGLLFVIERVLLCLWCE